MALDAIQLLGGNGYIKIFRRTITTGCQTLELVQAFRESADMLIGRELFKRNQLNSARTTKMAPRSSRKINSKSQEFADNLKHMHTQVADLKAKIAAHKVRWEARKQSATYCKGKVAASVNRIKSNC